MMKYNMIDQDKIIIDHHLNLFYSIFYKQCYESRNKTNSWIEIISNDFNGKDINHLGQKEYETSQETLKNSASFGI